MALSRLTSVLTARVWRWILLSLPFLGTGQ